MLVPSCVGLLYLLFAATVATHYLAEQHLCPAAAFDRGICNHRGMLFAPKALLHVPMALAVLADAAAVWIAPAGKRHVRWATLAMLLLAASYFGFAGSALSLFVAALVGAVVAAAATRHFPG